MKGCCREVVCRTFVEKCEGSVVEKCCGEVLW